MSRLLAHTVAPGVPPMGILPYLRRAYPALSPALLREALKKRDVRINNVRCGSDAWVRGGDQIRLYLPGGKETPPLRVLYEGEGLLVVEKPQGLPVDTDSAGIGQDTLLARARVHCPDARLCHRLDTGTGGVICLATDEASHQAILQDFLAEQVYKQYAVACFGVPPRSQGRLTNYLRKAENASRVRVYDQPVPGGRTAVCDFRLLSTLRVEGHEVSLMRVRLHTGRTHQIRVQMARMGCPVVGDDKYGNRGANAALHARMPALWCEQMRLRGKTFTSLPGFPLWQLLPAEERDPSDNPREEDDRP